MRKGLLIGVGLCFSLGLFLFSLFFSGDSQSSPIPASGEGRARVTIGEHTFLAELAMSQEAQATGLGYRDSLAEDAGMLFLFFEAHTPTFWMKGMRFPIDIIWIAEKRVVDISHEVPISPDDVFPPFYSPKSKADAVLEVNAGLAQKLDISPGNEVKWEILTSE